MSMLPRLRALLLALVTRLFDMVHPAMGALLARRTELHHAVWKSYRQAGMPYGDSEQGMLRWLREPEQAARLWRDVEALQEEKRQ